MQQDPWPPIKNQPVRVKSLYQRGIVDAVQGSGDDALYYVRLRVISSVAEGGKVSWDTSEPRSCMLEDLEPFDRRE
jgi:hypothetical protein